MSIVIPNPPDEPGDGYPAETVELGVQRGLTEYFISTRPVLITLVPRDKVKTSGGGYKWQDGVPRALQTMRLIEPAGPASPVRGSDGEIRETEFELLGSWDADIGQFDRFEYEGRDWEVAELYHFNGYEQRAAVIRRG